MRSWTVRAWAAAVVAAAVAGWVVGADEWPLRGLRVPMQFYPSGKTRAQVLATAARTLPDGDMETQSARMEFLKETGEEDGWVELQGSRYYRRTGVLVSDGTVRLVHGALAVSGVGFELDTSNQLIRVKQHVRVELQRGIPGGFGLGGQKGLFP